MDSYDNLPNAEIKPVGEFSIKFLDLGIKTFKDACDYVHNIDYGYNTNYEDKMIFFKENKGTCTTKHAVIAGLAQELEIPLYKHVCIYKFTEEITTGVHEILKKFEIPYIPMTHCFLVYDRYKFDLTEGNRNGKKKPIDDCIHTERVDPFISRKDEYLLFKKVLKEKILPSKEMEGIHEKTLLKARAKGIVLLLSCISPQL
ncbi:MAG: hypothetical protein E3J90_08170 [Promethearchaeota archaeon]|nr:MAG: hypothetical protein E3J90_08170 [Candidatus Lokiarchaeota archaeon]